MSGDVSDKKRLFSITEANLKKNNRHIYISGHHDFFRRNATVLVVITVLLSE